MRPVNTVQRKWRPSLTMVVVLVCAALISVPPLALLAARLTSNQFVRETEQSLIHQAAIYAEIYATIFAELEGPLVGTPLNEDQKEHWNANLHPELSRLNVRTDPVLPARPDGEAVAEPLDSRFSLIAERLIPISRKARKTTLAGTVFLDYSGRDLTSAGAPSLAALPEVQTALNGDIGAALRARGDEYQPHPLSSLSRDTGYRVFLTYPVIVQDRVIGVVYLSRTPVSLGKFLFQERYALLMMLASTVLAAAVIGLMFVRLVSRPIYGLRDESRAIAAGRKSNWTPLPHYGLRELAELGDSVSTMAGTLSRQSREMSTYTDHVTHELKSPVTAIIGAAELLQDNALDEVNRAKLLGNIETEGHRMSSMLSRLREMTRLRFDHEGEPGELARMLPRLDGLKVVMDAAEGSTLPLSEEHGRIILLHMAQNSRAHGASELHVDYADRVLTVSDDGGGVPESNRSRVAEPFFTTRREEGGTGMGLTIVAAMLEGYKATLECLPSESGAVFAIRFRDAS
ncbi:histidine kinase dimerization/phospho-acceptor domain-containing protein [Tabrizicola sp.]|uniref:histidine kinase dimerization/phospho-acceptor domain-containing protein n=1 Tax=Tabrizicola sp. TaxID=2005166 RepID=UPI003F375E05